MYICTQTLRLLQAGFYWFDILSMLIEFFSLKVKVNFFLIEFSTFNVEVNYFFFLFSPLKEDQSKAWFSHVLRVQGTSCGMATNSLISKEYNGFSSFKEWWWCRSQVRIRVFVCQGQYGWRPLSEESWSENIWQLHGTLFGTGKDV